MTDYTELLIEIISRDTKLCKTIKDHQEQLDMFNEIIIKQQQQRNKLNDTIISLVDKFENETILIVSDPIVCMNKSSANGCRNKSV